MVTGPDDLVLEQSKEALYTPSGRTSRGSNPKCDQFMA